MPHPSPTLRQRTRLVVRATLGRTAIALFAEKGFDATTMDEVAAAAGVSRRTLFNYFGSKEDLALSGIAEQGDRIAARLAERPLDEDPWTALRRSFVVIEESDATPDRRLELITLLFGNPALRVGHLDKQLRWQELLSPLIEPRLPDSDERALQARALVAASLVCLHAALEAWAQRRGEVALFDLYDAVVAAVRSSE